LKNHPATRDKKAEYQTTLQKGSVSPNERGVYQGRATGPRWINPEKDNGFFPKKKARGNR